MMEGQNGNSVSHRTVENGVKGKPPYSVETPYGFRLDLDFLKYVDDIEKGNTIKRVPIQRRSRGSRSSTLPRYVNLSGHGSRPSPWGSTGALAPKTHFTDGRFGHGTWTHEHRTQLSPGGFKSLAEMEARIRAFDEQPLGEHIRPNLLRASSLPLTVLLRQGSESTEDTGSLQSSRDQLGGRDTSSEDVYHHLDRSSDTPLSQDFPATLRQLTEALERVGELEMEVRVIPELRAQICILQEERERLRLGLNPRLPGYHHASVNGNKDSSSLYFGTSDVKRPRHDGHPTFPRDRREGRDATHEWRTSTDLDELLTVTSLQAKVAVLEQKLHESTLELQRASALLREQHEEGKRKEEKVEQLIRNPEIWVLAEKVIVDQDGEEMIGRGSLGRDKLSATCALNLPNNEMTVSTNGQHSSPLSSKGTRVTESPPVPMDLEGPLLDTMDSTVAAHHVRKIKRLLEKQWVCLCGGQEPAGAGQRLEHPDPKVNTLQQEMMALVDILTSYYDQNGHSEVEVTQHEAPKSIMKQDGSIRTSKNLHFAGVNEGCDAASDVEQRSQSSEQQQDQRHPGETAEAQRGADPESRRRMETDGDEEDQGRQTSTSTSTGGAGPESVCGGGAETSDAGRSSETAAPVSKQMERDSGSGTNSRGRGSVDPDFLAACQFLENHTDNLDNPNDDTRRALVVLFQGWFSVSAEEDSAANKVSLYLSRVKKTTPSLLAFMVNLADDNGNTALHYSLSHCNYNIVNLLLDTGVSEVDRQNKAGYTAVMLASLTAPEAPGDMEVIRRLMEMADVNVRSSQGGQTALQLAVRHGRVVMVRLLLSFGANANLQDLQGTTALMAACERGHTHIARLLLERSPCNLTLTDKHGRTALAVAQQSSHSDTAALIQAHATSRGL